MATNDGEFSSDPQPTSENGLARQERRGSWEAITDAAGVTYYYSYTTGETTWDAPPVFADVVISQTFRLRTAVSMHTVACLLIFRRPLVVCSHFIEVVRLDFDSMVWLML